MVCGYNRLYAILIAFKFANLKNRGLPPLVFFRPFFKISHPTFCCQVPKFINILTNFRHLLLLVVLLFLPYYI
jgi:hypothetical protein